MLRIKPHARREGFLYDGIFLHFALREEDGTVLIAKPIVFEQHEQGIVTEPALQLRTDEAQALMDELWSCGLRPTEGSGSAGSLAATERHLKDMQEIARGLLRKDGVEIK